MWSGRFEFGDLWAAYHGPAGENAAHAHAALQIAFAGGRPVRVELDSGRVIVGGAIVVGPLAPHRLVPSDGPVGILYLAPNTPLAAAVLASIHPLRVAVGSDPMRDALRSAGVPSQWVAAVATVVGATRSSVADSRLEAALRAALYDLSPGAVRRGAVAAGLSESRLRALAREQIHVPLSQWLLWKKLERAARALAAGESPAAAAVAGGFADQAHFARTMRRTFGITPRVATIALREQ